MDLCESSCMSEGSDDDAVLESQVTQGGMACEDSSAEEIAGMDLDSASATSSEQLSDVDSGQERPHLPVLPPHTKAEKQFQIDRMPPFGVCSGDRPEHRELHPGVRRERNVGPIAIVILARRRRHFPS